MAAKVALRHCPPSSFQHQTLSDVMLTDEEPGPHQERAVPLTAIDQDAYLSQMQLATHVLPANSALSEHTPASQLASHLQAPTHHSSQVADARRRLRRK